MQCISCGSQLESDWTHCPYCGNFKSLLQEPVTDEHVNSIFEKMFDRRMGSKEGAYGSGVRGQVFEVIVRQAMAGAPWRQICEGPMAVNKISVAEVLAEVDRRRKMVGQSSFKRSEEQKAKMDKEFKKVKETKESKESKETKGAEIHNIEEAKSFFSNQAGEDNKDKRDMHSTPPRPQPSSKPELSDSATVRLQKLQKQLEEFLENAITDKDKKQYSDKMMSELNEIANSIMRLETLLHSIQKEISITRDLERELGRTKKPINPDQPGDPHRIDW